MDPKHGLQECITYDHLVDDVANLYLKHCVWIPSEAFI